MNILGITRVPSGGGLDPTFSAVKPTSRRHTDNEATIWLFLAQEPRGRYTVQHRHLQIHQHRRRAKRTRQSQRLCAIAHDCSRKSCAVDTVGELPKQRTYAFNPVGFKELTWLKLNSPTVSLLPKAYAQFLNTHLQQINSPPAFLQLWSIIGVGSQASSQG
jgi:hypothetical protein